MDLPCKCEKTDYASIDIDLEHKKIFGGQKIEGKIKIDIKRHLDGVALKLSIICKEWCKIDKVFQDEKDVEQSEDIMPPFERFFINGTNCEAGSLKYDFELQTPESAPAAFEASYPHSRGFIRYLVLVSLASNGNPVMTSWKKVKVKEHLDQKASLEKKSEGTVQGYCYKNMGRLVLGCNIESLSTLTKVDDSIEGSLSVDNRGCPFDIKRLFGRLAYSVTMQAATRHASNETIISAWDFPEVKASQETKLPFKQKIPFDERYKTLTTSSKGKLLKREYKFTIIPEYDAFTCCVPNIFVKFDVENVKLHKKKDKH